MGRKHGAKTGGAAASVLNKQLSKNSQGKKAQPIESDNESEDSGNYMTFNKKDKDSDDEEDREVFNLAMDKDEDDEDESGDDSEDESGDSDESEDASGDEEEEDEDADDDSDSDDEDLEGDELKQLVDNLPSKLRQQIRKKADVEKRRKAGMEVESESDSEEEEESEQEEGWGKKKKTYWQGDTADLEIGQEMDDALEEEEAVKDLHREKTKRMKASDFMDEFAASGNGDSGSEDSSSSGSGSGSDSDSSAPARKGGSKLKQKSSMRADAVVGDLAQVSLGQDDLASEDDAAAAVQVERVSKNLAHLTKQQRLDLITKNSPELLGIVEELKDLIGDLKGRILPIKEYIKKISASHQVQDDVVDYLEVKQQLLLTYCINVVFYLYMKAQGKSVANHPVMKQLLKLRYVMEKMRPLDGKLKHQVDRLVQLAELSPQDLSQHTDLLRPNPFALLSSSTGGGDEKSAKGKGASKKSSKKASKMDYSDDEDEDEGEGSESEVEDDSEGESEAKTDGLYKVPKRTAVPYKESESALDRREKRVEKAKSKLKRSELMDTLREEFGSAPEAAASSGLGMQSGDLRKLQDEAEERRQFEEERFVRMTMSRKDKKDIKRRTAEASRLDNFDDIGDIADLETMDKLAAMSGSNGMGGAEEEDLRGAGKSSSKQSASMGSALQRAVMALAQSDVGSASARKGEKGSKKSNLRAMAEALGGDDDSDGDDPYAALLAAGPGGGGDDGNNRKRRRAPTSSMDSDMEQDFGGNGGSEDDEENLLEDFSQKKKKYLAEKKAHYTAEPQFGGFQETVTEGDKRAASYEIIKNKGLTPHRKKANRNPRVKKREMYDKAVIRRKGQVRDVVTGAAGAYAGELTGIKANVARSRKIGV